MVQALLAGRKTQTRRATHDNGESLIEYRYVKDNPTYPEMWKGKKSEPYTGWMAVFNNHPLAMPRSCPYGEMGDLLWVREEHYAYGWWEKNGLTKTGKQKWKFIRSDDPTFGIYFDDTKPEGLRVRQNNYRGHGWYKRLARFMPRKYCRIWLEITDIRVERVQAISEEDAMAEGVESWVEERLKSKPVHYKVYYNGPGDDSTYSSSASVSFETLWQKINGAESWQANPWVWALSFKVLSINGKPETL